MAVEVTRYTHTPGSLVIKLVEYNPDNKKLRVHFLEGETVWQYDGVSPSVYGKLVSAASIGKAFNKLIKDHFIGTRLYPNNVTT